MRIRLTHAAMAMAALALPLGTAMAASGTPQRSATLPTGLAKNFARGVPGLMKALIATQGSNSRLQDLPASP